MEADIEKAREQIEGSEAEKALDELEELREYASQADDTLAEIHECTTDGQVKQKVDEVPILSKLYLGQ